MSRVPYLTAVFALGFVVPAWAQSCGQHANEYNRLIDAQKVTTERLKAAKECSAEFFRAGDETAEAYRRRAAISRSIAAECPSLRVVPEQELLGLAVKMEETTRKLKGLC